MIERSEIINKLIELWQECEGRDRSVIDKADIDFVNKVASWIIERESMPIGSCIPERPVLIIGGGNFDAAQVKTILDEYKSVEVIEPELMEIKRSFPIEKLEPIAPKLFEINDFEEVQHSPIYTPKRKKYKGR